MKYGVVYDNRGETLYAVILDEEGLVWNGATFVTPAALDWGTYAQALVEGLGGIYLGTVPGALEDTVVQYTVMVYQQVGVAPDHELDVALDGRALADQVAMAAAAATEQVGSLAAAITALADAMPTVEEIAAEVMGYDLEGVEVGEVLKRQNARWTGTRVEVISLSPYTLGYFKEDGTTPYFNIVLPGVKEVGAAMTRDDTP